MPHAFGVLTCDTLEQAIDAELMRRRAGKAPTADTRCSRARTSCVAATASRSRRASCATLKCSRR